MLLLPLPESPAYSVLTEIEGVEYELVYTYDEHRDLWRLGVNRGDVVVMGHRPLLPFVQMRPNALASALDGVFALIAPLPTSDAYEALTGGLWSVVYGLPAEIAELADSLADLAGGTEAPVVPIDVVYPPNNAILSNPMVTFSGTGPANQLLFARGESIQVDGMGNWVWTHAFNEPSPVVVFEGESGQRATVRFSIIMQPLVINPIGEDIDGTRYVFTEDVEVTGTATPNSAITVNGQSVAVDSEGNWFIELTLQAGQSHVITAQAGDGQVAQTSVYVWGEPDVLALQPRAFLKRGEHRYIDAAQTQAAVDGDPVGAWVDPVRNVAFTQSVSANRPIAFEGGIQLIDGDVGKRLTAAGLSFGPNVSVYAMVRMTGYSTVQRPSIGCATPANSVTTGWAFGRMNSLQMTSVWGPSANRINNPPSIDGENRFSGTIPDLVRFTLNEGGVATGYLERTGYSGQLDHGPQTTTYDDLSIGNFSDLERGQEIFELLVFDRILSAEEDGPLMRWLNIRYAQLVEDLA